MRQRIALMAEVLQRHRRALEARRGDEEDRWAPATLLPPEAFSDAEATPRDFQRLCEPGARTGRHATAVHRRIAVPARSLAD